MTRRNADRLLAVLAALAILAPAPAGAQASGKVHRIAILALPGTPLPQTTAGIEVLRRELRDLGWVEGRTVVIEQHHVDRERLEATAARIVRERADLIVTMAIPAAAAAKKATSTIPIVMATSADPVGAGLVESLARPGGNVTGLSFAGHEVRGKRLELLKQMVPRLTRVGAVYHERSRDVPYVVQWLSDNERAAENLALALRRVAAKFPGDWDSTLAAARRDGVRALVIVESPDLIGEAEPLATAAVKQGLATMFGQKSSVVAGGLMAYGATYGAASPQWARAAVYVDKILRGAKPADLPIEQPSTFGLVINAKTANALRLTIPPVLRLQAVEIIE